MDGNDNVTLWSEGNLHLSFVGNLANQELTNADSIVERESVMILYNDCERHSDP